MPSYACQISLQALQEQFITSHYLDLRQFCCVFSSERVFREEITQTNKQTKKQTKKTNKQTEKQTDRQSSKQTDKHANKQTSKQTKKHATTTTTTTIEQMGQMARETN